VQRLDEDVRRRSSELHDLRKELVDQVVRELVHELSLPVVPVFAVGRVEHELLLEERLLTQVVRDEPWSRTERIQVHWRIRPCEARGNEERQCQRVVEEEHGLAAEVTGRTRGDIAKQP
jgi:hypothetical protein